MKKSVLLPALLLSAAFISHAQTVTDIDGNVYHTVIIGTQVWTQENLKVTRYRNGDPIPNITGSPQWYGLTSGAFCAYENDTAIAAVYGMLYNWYAVHDSRNLAPPGWRVPTFEDWDTLQIFLDYDLVAGGKLKEVGTSHWMFPNTGASDEYDFTALPGGQRADSIYSGTFSELTTQGYWWSSSEMDTTYPWGVNISYNSEGMTNWAASTRKSGFSIRLIKELALDMDNIYNKGEFNIYPNPAHGRVFIDVANSRNVTIAVYNLLGELLIQQELQSSNNAVNISELTPGLYTIKLSGKDRSAQRRLMVE